MKYQFNDKWQHIRYEEVTSTNDIAKNYANCHTPIIITAGKQTAGRGRCGRNWQSLKGNLFFSQLIPNYIPVTNLVFIVSLSIAETLQEIIDEDIIIKWPNDILVNRKKISGILIETYENSIIIGIGINLTSHPDLVDTIYPATDLQSLGYVLLPDDFLQNYIRHFDKNIAICSSGFSAIRQKWLEFAKYINSPIKVRCSDYIKEGIFKGIDEQGFLLLEQENTIIKIAAGDVFI